MCSSRLHLCRYPIKVNDHLACVGRIQLNGFFISRHQSVHFTAIFRFHWIPHKSLQCGIICYLHQLYGGQLEHTVKSVYRSGEMTDCWKPCHSFWQPRIEAEESERSRNSGCSLLKSFRETVYKQDACIHGRKLYLFLNVVKGQDTSAISGPVLPAYQLISTLWSDASSCFTAWPDLPVAK